MDKKPTYEDVINQLLGIVDEEFAKIKPEKKLAESLWVMYTELMAVGFTEFQAFELLTKIFEKGIK